MLTLGNLINARRIDLDRLARAVGVSADGNHFDVAKRVWARIRPVRVRGMYS